MGPIIEPNHRKWFGKLIWHMVSCGGSEKQRGLEELAEMNVEAVDTIERKCFNDDGGKKWGQTFAGLRLEVKWFVCR